MEYGILWVLYRGPADLETDDAPWGIQKENRCSICTWLCPDAAAWSIFRYIRDVSFRYHGASISDICCSDAADPSAIGLVEGLITAAVLCFVYEARPELLWGTDESTQRQKARFSLKKTVAILAVLTVWIGGGLSLFASANPDGLEWSMEKVAGTTELDAKGAAYQKAADIQEWTALLPDYAFKNSESMAGTSFSGVAGAAVVVAVCVGGCYLFKFFGKNQKHE